MKNYILLFLTILIHGYTNAQIINFQDINFKNKLLTSSSSISLAKDLNGNNIKIDANNNGEIEVAEALNVKYLFLSGLIFPNITNITNLEGIQFFVNLQELDCSYLQVNTISITGLVNLKYLGIQNNQILNVDLSTLNSLEVLQASNNPLISLNVNGLLNLKQLTLQNTAISTIDCSQSGVINLVCTDNSNLQNINVQNNISGYDDPDVLYFQFEFRDLPVLNSICLDNGDLTGLNYTNYDNFGSANVVSIFSGPSCTLNNEFFEVDSSKIYPNPFNSIINIESKLKIENYSIIDVTGKKLISEPNKELFESQCFRLSAGTYFLKLSYENNQNTIHKIIKI